jgi:two-component system cell cycle sensor histidine kinase/response regulator CckA
VRAAARTILKRLGYRVLDAEDGAAALRVASKHAATIDLLLTDVVMPGMNGRALADQLTRLRPGLRVLYMSGYPNHAIEQEGILEPGLAFVAKPFTPRALGEKVRETLDRPPTTALPAT